MVKEKILAKSTGQSLIEHSTLVSRIAVEIAKNSLLSEDEELLESIRLGGLLHDIGKCTKFFQKKINKDLDELNIESGLKYRHNEIGWAFLSRYLTLPKRQLSIILDSVYWHHGISNKLNGYNDTDVIIDELDVETMVSYLTDIIDSENIGEKAYKPKKAPIFYTNDEDADEKNSEFLFSRTCIISADRIASSLTSINITDEEIKTLINEATLRPVDIDIEKHCFFGNPRFIKQMEIVDKIQRTTQINAPAGFGKTLLGLLWNFRRGRKLIWVCPRNIVAESVYKSITEELENFGVDFLSTELYLSGEVQDSNKLFNGDFKSDIIVTNIDNYLSPSVENRNASRLHTIINSDVIFDEFHELIGENALFASFITIMMTRHRLTKSNTLLLSATPTTMSDIWDSLGQKTLILPNKHAHYTAPHNNKYLFNTNTLMSIKNISGNNLVIFNSIKNAQLFKKKINAEILMHSKFENEHRVANVNKLYENYGKNSERNIIKPNVVGTHIIQASLDVSFNNLYESVLSPQSTLQRIGRCDRWGDYNNQSSINIIRIDNRGENAMREKLYTKNLANMWFDHISKFNGQHLTLDELYCVYNEFETKNERVLNNHLRNKYHDSLDSLSSIYPIKFFSNKKSDNKTAGSNKLRTTNSEIFVICKYYNKNAYTNPFSVAVRKSFTEEFDENNNTQKKILAVMKNLRDENDERFDYNDILNNRNYITLDGIRVFSKKSNTPYIRFDKVYHPEYGEVSEETLKELLN